MRTTMIAIGQARRSSARACTPKSVGSMAQSTSNMSNPAVGACANVVDQSAVSPTISIFRSRNITRRALRSSGWASARNTRVMNSYCTKHSPATSNWWGVFASATWGRDSRGSVDQSLAQRQGDGFRADGGGLERALDQDLFREARQRNHLDRFGLVADEARRGAPIHVRHDHIHQNNIRLELDTDR